MSSTFVPTNPTAFSTISPELTASLVFSLLGGALSVAVLSYVSPESVGMMFSLG
jgi:hypothetical protein